jgi:hypothetical protein
MQFIYKDDVVLWNRLRPGTPGVSVVQMDEPADWQLALRIDGTELRFDEPLDLSRIREQASSIEASRDLKYPAGTERILSNGVGFFVHNGSLLHVDINAGYSKGRDIQLRTKLTEKWIRFPYFGVDDARTLFGEPDRTHEFFMH